MRSPILRTSRSPKLRAIPKPGARSRRSTAVWSVIGLLCCVGVLLAVVDPSIAGRSPGGSLSNGPLEMTPTGDDGFVAPRAVNATRKHDAGQGAVEAVREVERVDRADRDAHADALIQRLIEKMRAERAAKKAAEERARALAGN